MAAADQQFLDALKYLGQQGQQYGIKQQMDQVNDRAQEIQSTMTNEIERRQALRNLANTASLSVTGSGGSAQQAAAIQNLLPPIPTSVQSAYLQGSLTGDKQMVGVATQMQDEDEARQVRSFQRKAAFQMQLEMQKEKGKNDPNTLAILKENRKKYDDLMAGKQKALESLSKLNDIEKMLKHPGILADSGPADHYINGYTNYGQELQQKMNELSFENMHNTFEGMAGAIRTEFEQKAWQTTQLSDRNFPKTNLDYIATNKKLLQGLVRRANIADYSFKNTKGLSLDAFDDAPTKDTAPGFQPMAPVGSIKAFYKPAK
jgi:hypothetical protein